MAQQSPEEVAAARRIMACKDFIPLPLRFLIFLLIIIVYQFSGGVYMTAVTQMAGAMAWLTEDIMMAGYESFVGIDSRINCWRCDLHVFRLGPIGRFCLFRLWSV